MFVLFYRLPSLRTASNCFIVNLAVSDALFSASVGFPMMSIACFSKKWLWGQTGMMKDTCLYSVKLHSFLTIVGVVSIV